MSACCCDGSIILKMFGINEIKNLFKNIYINKELKLLLSYLDHYLTNF